MRIVVVGAGGVGAVLGAHLAQSEHRVAFVARGATLRALRSGGLRVLRPQGELRVERPEASDAPAALGAADAVFLCTKLYDLEEAARACRPLVRPDTLVVTLQNGVEADEIAARALGRGRVLAGLVYTTSAIQAPGVVRQSSELFRLAFGAREGESGAAARALEAACRAAGLDATLVEDVVPRLWAKLVFLASVGALTCLGRLRLGTLRASEGARALLVDAMREVVAVAAAEGVALVPDVVESALRLLDSLPPEVSSSMHADLVAGRRLEVDHLSGAVVRRGARHGVATPIHRTALACLLPLAGGVARAAQDASGTAPRPLSAGYRLSLRHDELQLDVVHAFLTRSYWSPGIDRALVEAAARNSLVAGAYDAAGRQVGYARLVTDRATFGYLADVFVLEEHRGRGLASALVRALLDVPEVRRVRRLLLATRDAHDVYTKLGWTPLADPSTFLTRRGSEYREPGAGDGPPG